MEVGYWLSSEEHGPRELVRLAARAEAEGFGSALISDHFHPWTRTQGQSPFVWGVLGAIAHATTALRVATAVTAPILRMHPAVVAHAAATAAVQFEGRFSLGVGSGERLNEHVTGQRWPATAERLEMLEEAIDVLRQLFEGDNVNHRGNYFTVENAQLFTRPVVAPEILVAAAGKSAAGVAGRVGDGVIATKPNGRVVQAFEAAGGVGKRRVGQLHVCVADSQDQARKTVVAQWPNAGVEGAAHGDLARPVDFEAVTAHLSDDVITEDIVCGRDPDQYVEAIGQYAAAGFTEVYLHQIGADQDAFFTFFDSELQPRLG